MTRAPLRHLCLLLLASLGASLWASCSRPRTQLVVAVEADPSIVEDAACYHVAVSRVGDDETLGNEAWFSTSLRGTSPIEGVPFSFGVTAPDDDPSRRVELRVSALRAGACATQLLEPSEVIVTDVTRTGYLAHLALPVRVYLASSCIGLVCAEGSVCRAGACVSPEQPPPPALEGPVNVAFVTSARHDGALGGLEAADAICNQEALDAGLEGHFVAWLALGTGDPTDRLGDARGWIRTDGRVVAYEQADLHAGMLVHPIMLDATGARVLSGDAWSNARGSGDDCRGWTSSATDVYGVRGRVTEAAPGAWASGPASASLSACNTQQHLYCFQVDHDTGAPALDPPTDGRRIFVSDELSGSPDQVCAESVRAAGLDLRAHALVASSTASALSRITLDERPWVRMDGQVVFLDRVNVTADLPRLPVLLDASARPVPDPYLVFTGAEDITTFGTATGPPRTCEDWTQGDGTMPGPAVGSASSASDGWFFWSFRAQCSTARRFYCLED